MKDKWTCTDLRKPTIHIVFDTLLLLLIVASYIPQLQLILVRRSTLGVTQSYVVLTYLFTATQFALVMIYSSYGRPIMDCIKDQKLRGLDAYGAIIGLVQMTVLWIGSTLLLITFLMNLDQRNIDRGTYSAAFPTDHSTINQRPHYPRTILSICVLHTFVWVLPAIAVSIPRPIVEPIFHSARIFVGYCDFLLIPACIILVTSIFPLQIRELLSSKYRIQESSLSPTTLALQMIALTLLAWSWKLSLGQPGDPFNITPPGTTLPSVLYRLGAWQWVNNMIFGVGQGLLLLIYLWVRSRQRTFSDSTQAIDETTALL